MADTFFLSEKDRDLVQGLLDAAKSGRITITPRPDDQALEDHQAPEVYIAEVPEEGIPALTAGEGEDPDLPGSATCDIYKINSDEELEAVVEFDRTVYNLASTAITSSWVLIKRTKYGRWIADAPGGVGASLLWGRVQEDMDFGAGNGNGSGVTTHPVEIKNCTWDGDEDGDTFTAWTALLAVGPAGTWVGANGPNKDTALWEGSIVNWQTEPDGVKIIVGDIWDLPIGTIIAWDDENIFIRDGWREMDASTDKGPGTASDTRGRYLRGEDQENDAGFGVVGIGGTGGTIAHDHDCHSSDLAVLGSGSTVLVAPTRHSNDSHIDPWFGTRFIERFE